MTFPSPIRLIAGDFISSDDTELAFVKRQRLPLGRAQKKPLRLSRVARSNDFGELSRAAPQLCVSVVNPFPGYFQASPAPNSC